jgi:hypothetical protein
VDFRSKIKCMWHGSHAKRRTHTGGIEKGRKPKTWKKCLMSPLQRS